MLLLVGIVILAVDVGILLALLFAALRRPDSDAGGLFLRLWVGCIGPEYDYRSIIYLTSFLVGIILITVGVGLD